MQFIVKVKAKKESKEGKEREKTLYAVNGNNIYVKIKIILLGVIYIKNKTLKLLQLKK